MTIGDKVILVKDIVIDKEHNGWAVFTFTNVLKLDSICESVAYYSPDEVIDIEQPTSVILCSDEYEVLM